MKPYRVVICGGGLAGLTLALQLRKLHSEILITVIEKTSRPLPEAAHKVGESTVEIGAHYLGEILGLRSYLMENHLPKLGLRYFYGDSVQPFENRPELGPSMFSPVPTYQLDRGILENDLREMVRKVGVELIENASLSEIRITEGEDLNEVSYEMDGEKRTILANWVTDAMGRRRYLQTKLGLKKESPHKASSVWFRMEGTVSVDELVPKTSAQWHYRNIENRYYSTNHLMGKGYWVWLIPLSSGNTSIGIVTQDDLHDFSEYSRSYETSYAWLERYEPYLAKLLKGRDPLDFRKMKNYSYSSKMLFSEHGWSCVGEAGIFSDPFYSPGSDMIAITNTFTCNLIGADVRKDLTEKKVAQLNRFILEIMFPDQLSYYVNGYHTFGNTQVAASKFMWDTLYYWRVYAHAFMNGVFADFDHLFEFEAFVKKCSELNGPLQREFRRWAELSEGQQHFSYTDLARKATFIESAILLTTRPSTVNCRQHWKRQLSFLMEMRNALIYHQEGRGIVPGFASYVVFYAELSSIAKLKNSINGRIARIGNGSFLYRMRNLYISLFVRGKERVWAAWLLRVLYAQ